MNRIWFFACVLLCGLTPGYAEAVTVEVNTVTPNVMNDQQQDQAAQARLMTGCGVIHHILSSSRAVRAGYAFSNPPYR